MKNIYRLAREYREAIGDPDDLKKTSPEHQTHYRLALCFFLGSIVLFFYPVPTFGLSVDAIFGAKALILIGTELWWLYQRGVIRGERWKIVFKRQNRRSPTDLPVEEKDAARRAMLEEKFHIKAVSFLDKAKQCEEAIALTWRYRSPLDRWTAQFSHRRSPDGAPIGTGLMPFIIGLGLAILGAQQADVTVAILADSGLLTREGMLILIFCTLLTLALGLMLVGWVEWLIEARIQWALRRKCEIRSDTLVREMIADLVYLHEPRSP